MTEAQTTGQADLTTTKEARKPYHTPELTRLGEIQAIVQSICGLGGDSSGPGSGCCAS
jgi:hypothetical protein